MFTSIIERLFTLPPKAPATVDALKSIISVLTGDAGLKANVSSVDMSYGISSSRMLNKLLATAIDETGVNEDGAISKADIVAIADYIQADSAMLVSFTAYHGTETGTESGFHLLETEGAKRTFRGLNVVDTVIDSIYLIGFGYSGDFLLDQNGSPSTAMTLVAGWLNYFLNGENRVYGTGGDDYLTSGEYSLALADAANETFDAGVGNDQIYAGAGDDIINAGVGNDQIYAGAGDDIINAGLGDDRASGGLGRDTIYGGLGADQLFGEDGNDKISGDEGDDGLNGGMGNDVATGGSGNDSISGNEGSDKLIGGTGDDSLNGGQGSDSVSGNDGNDMIFGDVGDDALTGGAGKDGLNGNDGADVLRGGAGADIMTLWDNDDARDVLVFETGDSGLTSTSIDVVDGFASGQDVINLRSFGSNMSFEDLDFAGGHASVFFDGQYLRIDSDGDSASDLIIQFNSIAAMVEADFLFA